MYSMTQFPHESLDGALARVASAAQEAERRLQEPLAIDAWWPAEHALALQLHIEDELADRFPNYSAIVKLAIFDNTAEQSGWRAIQILAVLRMLADAPDLVQLSLIRLADEFERTMFGEYGAPPADGSPASMPDAPHTPTEE